MRALPTVAATLSLLTVGACSNDLPAASFIDKLRVLAVRAEPPEVAPGETTALDLLAVEPLVRQLDGAAAAPLSAVWLACALPAGTLTVAPCGIGSEGQRAPRRHRAPINRRRHCASSAPA